MGNDASDRDGWDRQMAGRLLFHVYWLHKWYSNAAGNHYVV